LIRPASVVRARRASDAKPGSSSGREDAWSARRSALDALWQEYLRTRWIQLRNLLAEFYLPMVRAVGEQVAMRLPRTVDTEDLVSAGVFGLLQSIESFDSKRGTRFETFCRMRIRGAMIDELRAQDLLSREARGRANRVVEGLQRLRQELGREPYGAELAEATGLSLREVEAAIQKSSVQMMVSLDLAIRTNGDSGGEHVPVSEDLIDDHLEPSEAAHLKDLMELINRHLTQAERDILHYRYRDGLTMRRIGRLLGLSESRVCQLHTRLLGRLHRRLAGEA